MGILITDQLTQLSTESEVLNEVAKNPGIIRKYLQDLAPSLLGFLVQLMIAVIILLVGSRMIKMLVKMVRRFLERGKVEAGVVSFLSSFVKYALYFDHPAAYQKNNHCNHQLNEKPQQRW